MYLLVYWEGLRHCTMYKYGIVFGVTLIYSVIILRMLKSQDVQRVPVGETVNRHKIQDSFFLTKRRKHVKNHIIVHIYIITE